jgi:hypothetical protein
MADIFLQKRETKTDNPSRLTLQLEVGEVRFYPHFGHTSRKDLHQIQSFRKAIETALNEKLLSNGRIGSQSTGNVDCTPSTSSSSVYTLFIGRGRIGVPIQCGKRHQ